MRAAALLCLLVLGACAVKGYDLGWRKDGRITALLGVPLDGLTNCSVAPGAPEPSGDCAVLARSLSGMVAGLPPEAGAPAVLGARCSATRCAYANVYERRDVGTALIVPVYKRIVLREARIGFARGPDGLWVVETLTIRDNAPPGYGPVRVGAGPARN